MPKVIDPELKARAVRLVLEHRGEYPTTTAAVAAVAKQGITACQGGHAVTYDRMDDLARRLVTARTAAASDTNTVERALRTRPADHR